MRVYRCPVCGHLHTGEIDFHFCPVCGTPAEAFYPDRGHRQYANWDTNTRLMIEQMAKTGRYQLEGKGTVRSFLNMDDLIFLPAQVSTLPMLEDEPVNSEVIFGKTAARPLTVRTPVLISGMSFGALSKEAKMALAKASTLTGTIANTGEGGMLDEERDLADKITLQYASARFGASEERLKLADMIEIKISQGAKPGMGGKLPAEKVTTEIAAIRQIPPGRMAESPARHPDIRSARDLSLKIAWLRELTGGKPIALKFVGGRVQDDLEAIFSQPHTPDVLVIDGSEGGTGAAPVTVKDHVGLPLVYALPRIADYLKTHDLHRKVTLVATGGIRHPGDIAKAIALGAEAVYMAGAMKIALGCRYIRQCHLGNCPYGIATQDPKLRARLKVDEKAQHVANFINAATAEVQSIARICGKDNIHDLNKMDLGSLNPELSRLTGVLPA
jgi:glutamate synthase domain-containing protein 2